MIYHLNQTDMNFTFKFKTGTRWASYKSDRWWKHSSPRARNKQHHRAYNFEYNAAKAFEWMLDQHNWRRHPKPFSKTNAGFKRRQERRFHAQASAETLRLTSRPWLEWPEAYG